MTKKNGFTLAEILITLAIIGVVAAMTIPTLIAKINSIVTDNQIKVFNAKLIKGLNLTKTAGDLNDTYTSTYDFLVNGLGKNLKMAKVCDSDHIRDCIPYNKIKYEDVSGNEKTVDVKDITTVDTLNLKAPYMDPAAFVLADGTPVIVSYNKQCINDPDEADTTINACFAGVYDLNGSRKPNKYLVKTELKNDKTIVTEIADLRGFNGAHIGSLCVGNIGELCLLSTALIGSDYTTMLTAIQGIESDYTMPKTKVNNWNDYWQLGKDYCHKVLGGSLASQSELIQIVSVLYDRQNITSNEITNLTMKNQQLIYSALNIEYNAPWVNMWMDTPQGTEQAFYRGFSGKSTGESYTNRSDSSIRTICIAKE